MKKILFLILMFCTQNGYSQFMRMFNYTTAPTGACQFSYMAQNTTDGTLYYCRNGVWVVFTTPDITTVTGLEPRIKLNETDQTTDEKNWDFDVNSKVFTIRTRTDADGTGVSALTITRGTGTTLSDIVFPIVSSSGLIKSTSGDIRSGATGINSSYQFTGTNNWDIFHNDASDNLQFRRNSSQLAVIGPTGKFGIGSGTPGYFLDITQSSTSTASGTYPGIKISNTNTTTASLSDIQILGNNGGVSFGIVVDALSSVYGTGAFLITNTNHNLNFWTNNTARMQIAAGGNITPGADNSQDFGSSGTRWRTGYFGTSILGAYQISTTSTGPHAIGGASSSLYQLNLLGSFPSAGAATAMLISSNLAPAASSNAIGLDVSPTLTEGTGGAHNAFFGLNVSVGITAGTSTVVDAAGINVAAFTAASGTTNASTLRITNAPTGATNNYALYVVAGRAQFGGTIFAPSLTTASAATGADLCISSGEIVSDSALCIVSARRFKRDIQPIDVGMDLLKRLEPVRYHLKESDHPDQSKEMFGLIADDVALLDNRLVSYQSDGQVRSVFYIQLVPILIKAVQELEERVQRLEAK